MTLTASISYCPSFHDVDPMNIVWHGNYYRLFEKAREALFDQLHYGYKAMADSGFMYPIIKSECTYRLPLQLENTYTITARITECLNRLVVSYEITNAHHQLCAEGKTVQMAVKLDNHETQWVIPDVLLNKIEGKL